MAILDWLKEIPLSAVYKERLVDSEKQIVMLEQKIVELEARLSECQENRRALEKQIEQNFTGTHILSALEKEKRLCLFLEGHPRSTIKQISLGTGVIAQEISDKLEEYSMYGAAKRELESPSEDALWTLLQNVFKT